MPACTTILCVEDEPLFLDVLVQELTDEGYRAVPARNGREALRILETMKPDLILSDVNMPMMDGRTLLQNVRTYRPTLDDVPFLFLSGVDARDEVIGGIRLGADDYLTKPVDFGFLHAKLESTLAGARRIAESQQEQPVSPFAAYKDTRRNRKPVRAAIVTGNPPALSPVCNALTEVGCRVSILSDKAPGIDPEMLRQFDITFLVYSGRIHRQLREIGEELARSDVGTLVALVPAETSDLTKIKLSRLGISQSIEFPFRPAEIFKVIFDRLLSPAALVSGHDKARAEMRPRRRLKA